MRFSLKGAAFLAAVVLGAGAAQAQDKSLAQQIFEAMARSPIHPAASGGTAPNSSLAVTKSRPF